MHEKTGQGVTPSTNIWPGLYTTGVAPTGEVGFTRFALVVGGIRRRITNLRRRRGAGLVHHGRITMKASSRMREAIGICDDEQMADHERATFYLLRGTPSEHYGDDFGNRRVVRRPAGGNDKSSDGRASIYLSANIAQILAADITGGEDDD